MTIVWNGDRARQAAEREAAIRVLRAGIYFKNEHKRRLGVSNPRPYKTPSKPGEYPRARTHALQNAVMTDVSSQSAVIVNGMRIRIGLSVNVWYGLYLEQELGRLGFEQSVRDLKPLVAEILGAKA